MEEIKGLRWYKSDLHLHTTASECFTDKSVTAEQWVQKCLEEGLHCVAVTDHNTGNGIDEIKAAAEGKIVVFPGVEVTCGDSKQHVLVLFDPSKDSSYVNEFLNYIEIFDEHRAKELTSTNLSIFEVAEKASLRDGIAIAAHIDQFSGLSPLSHQNKERVCSHKDILGVQVVHEFLYQDRLPTDEELQTLFDSCYNNVPRETWHPWVSTASFFKNQDLAKLTFSDNPAAPKDSKHGLNGIGSRFTWIKMDEGITIQSLKQALLMPKIRIINDFDFNTDTKFNANTYIKSLKIEDTIYNQGETSVINFNPQLTTIIGGRGTGKSGILRMIRNSLNKIDELENHEDILKDHAEFCCKKTGELGVFTSQTKSSIKIVDGESNYKLNFDYNDGKLNYDLTVEYSNGERTEIPPNEIKMFLEKLNINLFSQKQIYDIAKRPDALRNFIDLSIPELEIKKQELDLLLNSYNNNLYKILKYEDTLSKKSSLEVSLKELELQKEKINIPIVTEILESDKKFTEENIAFQILLNSISKKIEMLQAVLKIDIELLNKEQFRTEYEEEINQINSNVQGYISSHNEILKSEIKSLTDFKDTLLHNLKKSEWNKNLLEHNEKLEIKQREQGDINQLLTQRKLISEKIQIITKERKPEL
ncbi:PHP domain-containing protein [Lysinibacillus sp. NPDC048646]|uniref:PHP domain-containing protein n=1 Tax=Lysinibacillus sp. NPDC048646 TaxID=3390574 RepID=UPI003D023F52